MLIRLSRDRPYCHVWGIASLGFTLARWEMRDRQAVPELGLC